MAFSPLRYVKAAAECWRYIRKVSMAASGRNEIS